MTLNNALEATAITKVFGQGRNQVRALNSLSLSVRPGEFVAIMGPSGCGKSTLLHVMSGLTNVDSGRLAIDGHDISTFNDQQLTKFRRTHVGIVFQAFNLITSLTAIDNVRLPMRDSSARRLRAAELLRLLGLEDRAHHRPAAMSGGEQQRVAIARALANDPAIVFADEPTGSLDSITGQKVCELLSDLCREHGKTIVLVTHEPSVARWASRILVMKDGQLVNDFPVDENADGNWVATHYQNSIASSQALQSASEPN